MGLLWCSPGRSQVEVTNQEQSARSSVDSWYHPAPRSANLFSARVRERQPKFLEVSAAFELQAEGLLRTQSARLISSAQAQQMSGGKYRATKRKPFLVRAVRHAAPDGGYSVILKGRNLFVSYGYLGRSTVPMRKQVLIVELDRAPQNVYREFNTAL